MKNIFAKLMASYLSDEKGLVTIEWVGIAAVVVVAGIVITSAIMTSTDSLGGDVAGALDGVGEQVGQDVKIPTFGNYGTP